MWDFACKPAAAKKPGIAGATVQKSRILAAGSGSVTKDDREGVDICGFPLTSQSRLRKSRHLAGRHFQADLVNLEVEKSRTFVQGLALQRLAYFGGVFGRLADHEQESAAACAGDAHAVYVR